MLSRRLLLAAAMLALDLVVAVNGSEWIRFGR